MKTVIARRAESSVLIGIAAWALSGCAPVATAPFPVPFAPPLDIAGGQVHGVSSLDARDIDGDGLADVAVICGGIHGGGSHFSWYQAPVSSEGAWIRRDFNPDAPLKRFLGAAKLADFDGDGDADLVVSSDHHSGDVRECDVLVLENPLPDGPVTDPWPYHLALQGLPWHHVNDMETVDMDRDGLTDITFTGHVLRAPPAPRHQPYVRIAVDGEYAIVNQNTKESIGDIDGDGRPDLLLAPAEKYRGGQPHDLVWFSNPGGDLTGAWKRHVVQPASNNMHTVKLADMNDDTHLDIVVGIAWGDRSIQVFYNLGIGRFSPGQIVSDVNGLYSGAAVDVDGDGDTDIIGQETYARNSRPYLYRSLLRD